jgi:hypothetical protein
MSRYLQKRNLIYGVILSSIFPILFFSCTPKSDEFDANKVINKLSQMSDLGTVEFQFSKIIKAEDEATWFKVGSRKVLISSKAYVKAGIDFSTIKINEVDKASKKVSLTLPKGKIISIDIPSKDIKVVFTDLGSLRSQFSNKEFEKIQIMGEKSIKDKISEMKLEEEAAKKSRKFLENWLRMSGFNEILIN